jgi:hypothetical protein
MRPQDIVVLLKILTYENDSWYQSQIANALNMSQSEISESIARSKYAGLIDENGKKVFCQGLLDFLQYGIKYAFPQQPGPVVRGIPTAHSMSPFEQEIQSSEAFVWPSARGQVRGHSIVPLYPSVVNAVQHDLPLHELLAMVDALRVGRTRERNLAIEFLKSRLC